MAKGERFKALRLTLPVACGYLFLGTAFGAMLAQAGFGPAWALAASGLVYAGSLQFVMVPFMAAGTSLATVALTALMVNARHIFYGLSFIERFSRMGAWRPYMIFSLTDETYSVFCSLPGEETDGVMTRISLYDQMYWVTGSVVGGLLATNLPFDLTGIDFSMTALFVTVFVEQWTGTREHRPALLGVGATVLCLALFGQEVFLIPSMLVITLALTALRAGLEGGADHA